jgi:hypothetical protein
MSQECLSPRRESDSSHLVRLLLKIRQKRSKMRNKTTTKPMRQWVAVSAVSLAMLGGGYGIANAATGTGTAKKTTRSASASTKPAGGQRSDETLLTGDTLAKVSAAALAKVSGGTIVRAETDADGNALYEAHMTNAAGTAVTVYVDKDFNVVSVDTRSH